MRRATTDQQRNERNENDGHAYSVSCLVTEKVHEPIVAQAVPRRRPYVRAYTKSS
jgi:hypothetical protein